MPLLTLLQNIHIRVLLVLFWFPVFDWLKRTIPVPLKGAGGGGVQQGDNIGVIVADGVEAVNTGIVGVIRVSVALVTGGEAPAAVPVAVRLLPVAVANLAALHRDAVGGDAATGFRPVGEQILHVLCLHMEVPVAAGGLVQFLTQRLYIPSHLLDFLVAHHLTEVIGQRILSKIR